MEVKTADIQAWITRKAEVQGRKANETRECADCGAKYAAGNYAPHTSFAITIEGKAHTFSLCTLYKQEREEEEAALAAARALAKEGITPESLAQKDQTIASLQEQMAAMQAQMAALIAAQDKKGTGKKAAQ
ncbi:MAG TPA: hypothetical protein VEI97_07450 [bacterium]|nr:hypothetical protein [bacterium]